MAQLLTLVNEPSDEEEQRLTNSSWDIDKKYFYEKTCDSLEEAQLIIISEKTWGYAKSHRTKGGKRLYYRCNLANSRGKQCSTGIYIFLPANSTKFEIHRTNCKYKYRKFIYILYKNNTICF